MIRSTLFPILLLISINLFSQNENMPLLERNVTICTNGVSAQSVLSAIAQQGGFVFSYKPSIIPEGNVSICIENQPVRVVLNTMFDGVIDYSIKGKYVILKKSKVDTALTKKIVEGYITDAKTGERITNASIYDKDQMLSAITNKYGYFKLEVPEKIDISQLHLSKEGYSDTLLIPAKRKRDFFNIKLASKQIFEKTTSSVGEFLKSPLTDSLSNRSWLPTWLLTQPIKTHVRNVSDTLFKRVQISFLPFISTNKLLTANTANDISINILAGYTQEVRKFEVGGILNIVRKDVKSAQFAGVGNIVGGSFKGVQGAGTFNILRDSLRGAQLAGVANIIGGSFTGLQSAGTFNICNTFKGLQLSGTLSFSTSFDGAQIAGLYNESRYGEGVQLSGLINTTKELTGTQVAGLINIAKEIHGTQVSGALNIAKRLKGTQVTGLANISSYMDGLQIATINIADTCDGVPIGFFSYVKKGYHKLEFSFDEMRMTNASFRTGVKLFHNIFNVGINPSFNGTPIWSYGYGLGTSLGNPEKVLWDIDITSNQFVKENNWSSENSLYRIYAGFDWRISTKTSIATGLTYNFFVTKRNETDFNNSIKKLIPYTISNSNSGNNSNLKTWMGARIAVRFF